MSHRDIFKDEMKNYSGELVVRRLQVGAYSPYKMHDGGPHRHDYYQMIWLKKGKGTHLMDEELYACSDSSLYLIYPYQIHQLIVHGDVEGFIISFSKVFLNSEAFSNSLLVHSSHPLRLIVPKDEEILFDQEVKTLFEYASKDPFPGLQTILQNYLYTLLLKTEYFRRMGKGEEEDTDGTNYKVLKEFVGMVERHYKVEKFLPFYQDRITVSPRKLYDIVKGLTGFSPAQFIEHFTFNEVVRELMYSSKSLKEIAGELGFYDDSYFVKAFKKHYGETPLQFRERYSQNSKGDHK